MIRSVMKHSYIRGPGGLGRALAHVDYAGNRGGADRGVDGREFFNDERDGINSLDVMEHLHGLECENGVFVHKMMMSPGVDGVDIKAYTCEVMEGISEKKGQDLQWHGVVHENTAHPHAHVLIDGVDKDGFGVRFNKDDYTALREFGDAYLSREHMLDRYLDREMSGLLLSTEYRRSGDELFRGLFGRTPEERERGHEPERARADYDHFDDNLRKWLWEGSGDLYPVRGSQRQLEDAGRLSESHGDYTAALAQQRLNEMALERPDLADSIQAELAYLKELARENRQDSGIEAFLGIDSDRQRLHESENGEGAPGGTAEDMPSESEAAYDGPEPFHDLNDEPDGPLDDGGPADPQDVTDLDDPQDDAEPDDPRDGTEPDHPYEDPEPDDPGNGSDTDDPHNIWEENEPESYSGEVSGEDNPRDIFGDPAHGEGERDRDDEREFGGGE